MTWASMLRALSQRANQKPSRPASKATTMRSILHPAFSASSRHRWSSLSNALSSTASFFNGWRSMPGTIPATSQLDRPISMTAINVLVGSRAMRDRLKSFSVCMGSSIGSQRRWMQYPRRRPIASSIMGFEDEVEQSIWRPCRWSAGPSGHANSRHPSSREGLIVSYDGQHAAMQDDGLFAQCPQDNEQWFHRPSQVGDAFDQFLDAGLKFHLPDHSHLETE